jgi:AraC family transcriptional regulator
MLKTRLEREAAFALQMSHSKVRMASHETALKIIAKATTREGVAFQLRHDPPGTLDVPDLPSAIIAIHLGVPTRLSCRRNNRWDHGTFMQGDIGIIPPHSPSRWIMHDDNDIGFLVSLPLNYLRSIGEENHIDGSQLELMNRFHMRDPVLESICWAMKQEIEAGQPSGPLFLEGVSIALASRLISHHSSLGTAPSERRGLSKQQLRRVLEFIEENLERDLRLAELSRIAGVSLTQIKALFRESIGTSAHQHIIARRIERAKNLLSGSDLSMAEIAGACGFTHQSHMAKHLRRATGMPPRALKRLLAKPVVIPE